MKLRLKNNLLVLIAFAVLVSCCACKRTYVPSKREILKDPTKYCIIEKPEMYYDQVCENWGEPESVKVVDKESKVTLAAWECRDRHIFIYFDKKGKAISISISSTFTCTVLYRSSGLGVTGEEPYIVALSNDNIGGMKSWRVILPEKWIPANILKKCENGTVLEVEFGGVIMQSDPCHISEPYSIKLVG